MLSNILKLAAALEPIGAELAEGASIAVALGSLSVAQWMLVAAAAVPLVDPSLGEELKAELAKLLKELEPHLVSAVHKVEGYGPEIAAKMMVKEYAKINGDAAIKHSDQDNKDV